MSKLVLLLLGVNLILFFYIFNSIYQYERNFFSTIVQLCNSKMGMTTINAMFLILIYIVPQFLIFLFFGGLRPTESESIKERIWSAVTDTFLAFAILSSDLSSNLLLSLVILLCLKYMHFTFEVRIGSIERDISIPKMTMTKNFAFFLTFLTVDIFYAHYLYAFGDVSANVRFLMINEYIVLSINLTYNMAKLLVHYIDYLKNYTFHSKLTIFSYLYILKTMLEAVTHVIFVTLTILRHGVLPILFARPLLSSFSAFIHSVRTQINCNKVVGYINKICPDASAEDINRSHDTTCVVCREEMIECKKLPCGHMFHIQCLKAWFQRQQSCPTCRLDILSMINNIRGGDIRTTHDISHEPQPQNPKSIYDERFEECDCIECKFFHEGGKISGITPDPQKLLNLFDNENLKKLNSSTVDRNLLNNIRINLEAAMAQTALLEERLKLSEEPPQSSGS